MRKPEWHTVGKNIGPGGPFFGSYTSVTNESIEATSRYISVVIGGAYQIIDSLSMSVGNRLGT
jgi:hypothetical protein